MNLLAARYIDRWAGVAVHLGLHAVGRATGRRLPPPGATTPPSAGRTWARPRRALAGLVQALRARGYDTVLDFEQFLKVSGIFGFLSGAPELIGFDTEGQHRGWLYTTRVVSTDSVHTRDLFLRLAAPLGVPSGAAPAWRLPVADADRAR